MKYYMRHLKNDLGGQAYSVKLNDLDLLCFHRAG